MQPDFCLPFYPRGRKEKLSFRTITLMQSESWGGGERYLCEILSSESTKPAADPDISRHKAMETKGSYTRVQNCLWSQIKHWTQCCLVGSRLGSRHLRGSSPVRPRGGRGCNLLVFITASPSSGAGAWAEFDETKINTDTQHLVRLCSLRRVDRNS